VADFGVGERPSDPRAADLNGDGWPDVVLLNRPAAADFGELTFLFARADGLLQLGTPKPITCVAGGSTATCRPNALTVADLNGDGSIDLAVALFNPGAASVGSTLLMFGNTGDGSFAPGDEFTTEPEAGTILAADVTGTGLPDVVVTSRVNNSVQVLLNVTPR
jgi:hypothetical protein